MSNTESNYSNLLQDKLLKIKISKLEKDFLNFKKAYPNYSESMSIPGEHNLEKWVQTLKDIYFKNHQGMPWKQATDSSTEGWNELEKNDFDHWVNFYQQQGHLKYKKASWYISPDEEQGDDNDLIAGSKAYAGYRIPNALSEDSHGHRNSNLHSDVDFSKNSTSNDISAAEKRKLIEKHKKKLISRLDSVERLLRSDEGDLLAESESDSLMDSIHALKRKILKLNKKTSGDLFYKDLIIREANVLAKNGLYKAASYLYVVAEDKKPESPSGSPPPPAKAEENKPEPEKVSAPPPPSPPPPSVSTGAGSSDSPNEVSGMPPPQPTGPDSNSQSKLTDLPGTTSQNETGAAAVAANLGTGFFADDQNNLEDDLMVYDENLSDDLDDYLMVAEAQEASPAPAPAAPSPEITVTEKDFDSQLDSVLSGVTVEDIVKKIEELSKVFKTREIPRQLAMVDMMLDSLGLASFFPSLSEATNKALESNNYILTRVEGILTQLSGAVKTKSLDLTHEAATPPQAEAVKGKLQEEENIEKERKEMRKELSDKALEERAKEDTPELEVTEEDLGAPAPEAAAPAAPPAAAPAAPAPPQTPPPAI